MLIFLLLNNNHQKKGQEGTFRGDGYAYVSMVIVVMVSDMYAYFQTHQIAYIKCHFLCISTVPQ